ncbi:thioredoxion [Thecamonas trahens ATCC 50062]|uniref:Thioredoxion n=1 Tax=Thecamonas trahens ATCC 50062 TaxID=461836 RepID=A0A0L0D7L5_THETB|nr:thioredoxion [Thecamonas trahens ATCC 50062]KNC48190.1 thioredoxion [Thecamonas trahens ATCC 50062]|eukprot:XP_013758759.1 thioredoxion [Thecamonas trahens ATCC 50062]
MTDAVSGAIATTTGAAGGQTSGAGPVAGASGDAAAPSSSLLWNVAKAAGAAGAVLVAGAFYLWKAAQAERREAVNAVKRRKYIMKSHRKKAERGAQNVPFFDGVDLVDASGTPGFRVTADKEVIVLYIAAGWCPPCHTFTPLLTKLYNQAIEERMPVEVVMLSVDQSADDMLKYMSKAGMDWLAAEYSQRPTIFQRVGEISDIPTVIVMTPDGRILDREALAPLVQDGMLAFHKWLAESRNEEWVDPNDPDANHPYPLMRKLDDFKL